MVPKTVWNSYFKFCFERNPYDKFISWYYWTGNRNKDITMKEFIESGDAAKIKGFDLYTENGVPVVDEIFRYEELDEAIAQLNHRLNPENPIQLPEQRVKGFTRKDKRQYRDVLGVYEKEAIEKLFHREIALLNYTF